MRKHEGKRLCITGIAAVGKSTLARKLADSLGGLFVDLDDLREDLASDKRYRKWTNFYLDQDEEVYYATTTPEDQWKNLVAQSEGLWPAFLEKIDSFAHEKRPVIFECVNLLPHLVHQSLSFPCIVLVGSSYDEIHLRNLAEPRWGSGSKLIELNSKSFFYIERPRYIEEAEKYNYPVFENTDVAYEAALSLLK